MSSGAVALLCLVSTKSTQVLNPWRSCTVCYNSASIVLKNNLVFLQEVKSLRTEPHPHCTCTAPTLHLHCTCTRTVLKLHPVPHCTFTELQKRTKPYLTPQHQTALHRTAEKAWLHEATCTWSVPHRTVPHRTAPNCTEPQLDTRYAVITHRTVTEPRPYRNSTEPYFC